MRTLITTIAALFVLGIVAGCTGNSSGKVDTTGLEADPAKAGAPNAATAEKGKTIERSGEAAEKYKAQQTQRPSGEPPKGGDN